MFLNFIEVLSWKTILHLGIPKVFKFQIKSQQIIPGVPEKMFLSEIGALLIKEHFLGTPGT